MIIYKIMNTDDVFNNFDEYCIPEKIVRLNRFKNCFLDFLKYIDSGKKDYKSTDYFNYMNGRHKRKSRKILEEVKIYKSIKKDGLINPIDMYVINNKAKIVRGYRRLMGLHHLKRKDLPCRIFDSIEDYRRLKPSVRWK